MGVSFGVPYRPLYFLASLGVGGMSVSLFMYLMFLLPHEGSPIPTYADLERYFASADLAGTLAVAAALAGIAVLAAVHLWLLAGSLAAHRRFVRTPEYQQLRSTNAEVTLVAVPLTLAMTVNVLFIVAALAVPGLWDAREALFPFALLAFALIGTWAFVVFGRYLTRVLTHKNFDLEDTNHFSQILPSFAFAMVAVGFSASAAMSHTTLTSTLGMMGSFVFVSASVAWLTVKLPVSFGAMLRHGMSPVAGPTLWMGIPILTLFGITFLRDASGIAHNVLDTSVPPFLLLVAFGLLLSAQLVMGGIGWVVMRRQGYFETYLRGSGRSIPAYGLVCPGVALSVLAMFFIHWGLVNNDVIARFGLVHWLLMGAVAVLQVITLRTIVQLNARLLGRREAPAEASLSDVSVPATAATR